MANLGPASVQTVNSTTAAANVNGGAYPLPLMQNALRLLASARAAAVSSTGDIPITLNNLGVFSPQTVVITNGLVSGASSTVAAVNLGIFPAAGATGTAIRTAGVLTGQTASNIVTATAAASTLAINSQALATPNTLYINVTAALANATVDIFIYGYDLT